MAGVVIHAVIHPTSNVRAKRMAEVHPALEVADGL